MREAPGGGGEDGAGDQARTSDRRRASCDDETCCDDVGARACAANDGDGREASSRGVLARESIRERFVTRFASRPNEIATAVTRRGATPARTTMRPRETLWLCAFFMACVAATARAEMFLPRFLSHSGETKPTHNDHPRRLARADPLASAGHDVLARPDDASRGATPSTRPPPPPTPATPLDSRPADANADPNLSAAAPVRTRAVTWGVGGDRLGRPSDPRPVPPAPIEGIPANESVVWAAASGHTALVTDVGHLYTAGRNDSAGGGGHGSPPVPDAGQLGRGGDTAAFALVAPDPAAPDPVAFVQVSCGRYHTAAVTARGGVQTFGLNDRGQLGRAGVAGESTSGACLCDSGGDCACAKHSASAEAAEPGAPCHGGAACRHGIAREVDLTLAGVDDPRAVMVAAGRYAVAAALASGEVVTWGLNACGGDGGLDASPISPVSLLSDPALAATPRLVRHAATNDFRDDKAVAVVFGYTQMLVLVASGALYSCDTGFDGYAAGLGGAEGADAYVPNREKQLGRPVASREAALAPDVVGGPLAGKRVAAMDAGRCHGVVAAEDGRRLRVRVRRVGRRGTPRRTEAGERRARARGGRRRGGIFHPGAGRGRRPRRVGRREERTVGRRSGDDGRVSDARRDGARRGEDARAVRGVSTRRRRRAGGRVNGRVKGSDGGGEDAWGTKGTKGRATTSEERREQRRTRHSTNFMNIRRKTSRRRAPLAVITTRRTHQHRRRPPAARRA